jgi:hypothetical protein
VADAHPKSVEESGQGPGPHSTFGPSPTCERPPILRLMNTPQRIVAALGICAVIVIAPVAAEARPARNSALVIKLLSVTIAEHDHDIGPKGPSAGDWGTQRSALFNAVAQLGYRAHAVVGFDSGTMRLTGPRSGTVRQTTHLPGGTLLVRGPISLAAGGGILSPVVAGTGRYAGAKGTPSTSQMAAVRQQSTSTGSR